MIREILESEEHEVLSSWATKSDETLGRAEPEEKCNYRTDFQRDRDRILHSKAFRRLMHKTQVFLAPEGDHYRTRLTHSLEVSQISRAVARGLRLNEDLTEAIALGHDLGHAPFGHTGESALDEVHKGGFKHRVHSLRIVDLLEKKDDGREGLNLTMEVRDGILNHSGPDKPFTPEGQIVKICDRVAYINHDIDDAIRAGIITREDLPKSFAQTFGISKSDNIGTMIKDLIENSKKNTAVGFSLELQKEVDNIREFMFENVYLNDYARREKTKVISMIQYIYKYYYEKPDKLPKEYYEQYLKISNEAIKDYIAGMTDRYSIHVFSQISMPKKWAYRDMVF